MEYKCGKCGIPIVVIEGTIIKPCTCDAPIIADMTARAIGVAMVNKEKAETWQDSQVLKN